MKKTKTFQILRILPLLILGPLVYWAWDYAGSDAVQSSLHGNPSESAIRLGKPAPNFTADAKQVWSKQEFKLSSLKGYPVILHFWATWCGPCLQELPEILQMAETYRAQGYSFVAIAVDDSWSTLETFFARNPHLAPLRDRSVLILDPDAKIANTFGSSRFPETFLINSAMIIDNKFIGAQNWSHPGMGVYLKNLKPTP